MSSFAQRLRDREQLLGYWVVLDAPVATERLARIGYDYIAFDAQHGLMGYDGMLQGLMAVDAGSALGPARSAGVVRVESSDPAAIGHALDAGASGIIVPLVNTAEQAARAVEAVRYPPHGVRSYGPMRSQLRIGPVPADTVEQVAVLAMIETAEGLSNLHEICATPGLDGVYVGPSDLSIGLGGRFPNDPEIKDKFDDALARVATAAASAGIAAGIHTPAGEVASERLAAGFTFASIASDLVHLEAAAATHLTAARNEGR